MSFGSILAATASDDERLSLVRSFIAPVACHDNAGMENIYNGCRTNGAADCAINPKSVGYVTLL